MAMFIVKPWYRKKDDAIYGAEWAGTSDPSWTRTDAAVGFSDPNPYYAGMSTSPSSPFDNIMPWSGMRRVTDANAGELVEIPKFYYKWTRDGVKMKLQISMTKHDGFLCSPAHADRGDGVGERDYVYVGRYHCASDYKSKTGVTPMVSTTRAVFRSGIHNLGANVWQYDFATRFTLLMLYLVEFAHWNSQLKIGYGCGNGSSIQNVGSSDSMPYHTGTMKSSRTTYGVGVQYRYIEGLWDNAFDFIDGCYYKSDTTLYIIMNPNDFSDSSGGTSVGSIVYGFPTSFNIVNVNNKFSFFVPSSATSAYAPDTYMCDAWLIFSGANALYVGGSYNNEQNKGLFYFNSWSEGDVDLSSRLMVLPPSRLSA